ncbi:MAG: hypothetical protein D6773_12265 [Alphaproteobacteria bacterium]|nr:MAG: hypothetical protein D6773_12265 [Alphaproteobacteria bacterium]
MKRLLFLPALLVLGSQAWAAGDAGRGLLIAKARCLPCHHLDRTGIRIGPGLKGIYQRKPRISGVPFARWDEAALDAWLSGPRLIKPNTKMILPPLRARDREDLIAYFRDQQRKGG